MQTNYPKCFQFDVPDEGIVLPDEAHPVRCHAAKWLVPALLLLLLLMPDVARAVQSPPVIQGWVSSRLPIEARLLAEAPHKRFYSRRDRAVLRVSRSPLF
jgi:hypothetical protein